MNGSVYSKIRVAIGALLLLVAPCVSSTSMQEPQRERTVVSYANGDELSIECSLNEPSCTVNLRVNGVFFRFGSTEVGAVILPFSGVLYSGEFSGRDRYFSLAIEVECPDNSERVCEGSILVEDGKASRIDIRHSE